jgi:hypothetical protein
MSQITIEPVRTWRQQRQFLHLPWSIYCDDPHWVPPLIGHVRKLVGFARHPFHQRNQAQAFLAVRGGQPCGRIVAIVNRAHNERFGERRGFFGFFESADDPAVAAALFDAARGWLHEHRIDRLRGPVNPSLNYEAGLLVEGFDSAPFFMMTYNPPYYARLIEGCGLQKSQDLFAYWGHVRMLDEIDEKLWRIPEQAAERFGVMVRPMNASRFDDEVHMFLDIYNQSALATWGFVPMSPAEMKALSRDLRRLIVPELVTVS